jgi:hypothetical protein
MMNMLDTNCKNREATCKEVAAWTAKVFWDMAGGQNGKKCVAEDQM